MSRQREKTGTEKIQLREPQYLGGKTKEGQQGEVQWQSHLRHHHAESDGLLLLLEMTGPLASHKPTS